MKIPQTVRVAVGAMSGINGDTNKQSKDKLCRSSLKNRKRLEPSERKSSAKKTPPPRLSALTPIG
jgi:hypothetical protein